MPKASLPDSPRPSTAKSVTDPPITDEALGINWRDLLLPRNSDKPPYALLSNIKIALTHAPEWSGVLGFNEHAFRPVARQPPPWDERRKVPYFWGDEDDINTADWLQHHGLFVSSKAVSEVVYAVSRKCPFHPVRDYLESIVWDGDIRLPTWTAFHLGSDRDKYHSLVGRFWMISAVARIYDPGCQVDTCIVLEGSQGKRKSSALRALGSPWFLDDPCDPGTKDAKVQLQGKWIIEYPELDRFKTATIDKVKSWITERADNYVPKYLRHTAEVQRGCVFSATVNHATYLRDETGARRFWPIKTGWIRHKELIRDRDQLWAEAVYMYKAGEQWWTENPDEIALIEAQQAARYDGDPWDGQIRAWIGPKLDVSVVEILHGCFNRLYENMTTADSMRVGKSLVHLGWERYQKRVGSEREWRYRRKSTKR